MSFPLIASKSLYENCLNPLWGEIGIAVSKEYHEILQELVGQYAEANPAACQKYMEKVNGDLLKKPVDNILDGTEYHLVLQRFFYERVYGRLFAKLKMNNRSPDGYFNVTAKEDGENPSQNSLKPKQKSKSNPIQSLRLSLSNRIKNGKHLPQQPVEAVPANQKPYISVAHLNEMLAAIYEEFGEITNLHDVLTREAILQNPPESFIKAYKHKETWFRDVNNDLFLEVIEVLMDAGDKGNSLGNKISQQVARANANSGHSTSIASGAGTGSQPGTKPPFMISDFQIVGIVISFFYLCLSVVTPLYKKFALKRKDPLINRWSLRYFIPAVILFSLGVVALTVSGVGIWIGLTFSIYSLASNIFKVGIYFKYYFDLKRSIKENLALIPKLQAGRERLHKKIAIEKAKYDYLVREGKMEFASSCANLIFEFEKEHLKLSVKWLKALSDQEELEVKRIRTLDKFTGGANLIRLGLAVSGCLAVILTIIPVTMPIGIIISFTVLCVGTLVLASHHANKFKLIKEEKARAAAKRDEFKPEFEKFSSYAQSMKKLNDSEDGLRSDGEMIPLQPMGQVPPEHEGEKLCPSVIKLLFIPSHTSYHPDPDPDERPGGATFGLGI